MKFHRRLPCRLVTHFQLIGCILLSICMMHQFYHFRSVGPEALIRKENNMISVITDTPNPRARQYTRQNKRGRTVMRRITNISAHELLDLTDDLILKRGKDVHRIQETRGEEGKELIMEILKRAGVEQIDKATLNMLPTWTEVKSLYYAQAGASSVGNTIPEPVIAGHCDSKRYRGMVLGVAGFFNSGTNALTYLLRANLAMPELEDSTLNDKVLLNGIMTQVPWDKHWFISLCNNHTVPWMSSVNKSIVLPIVVIRDPFTWFQSMQQSPYMVEFSKLGELHKNTRLGPVLIPKMTFDQTWPSLFHLWNDWYSDYLSSSSPFLMIRVEDLWFQPERTLDKIRKCTGARWINDDHHHFTYVVDSSKWEHVRFEGPQSNLVTAIIKHANPRRRSRNLTKDDLNLASQGLDPKLMRMFHYNMPTMLDK